MHDHHEDDDLPAVPGVDDDDECGPPTESDRVDAALDALIETLVESGYDEEVAEEAVFDAMSTLTSNGMIVDTPDLDEPDEAKSNWIVEYMPRIRQKLRDMGLEFTEA